MPFKPDDLSDLNGATTAPIEDQYMRGVRLLNSDNPIEQQEGARWIIEAAESGDFDAKYQLARLVEKGDVPNNHPEDAAFRLYEAAANAGIGAAMFRLGSYFENGDFVERDPVAAIAWYEKSLDAGCFDNEIENDEEHLRAGLLGFDLYNEFRDRENFQSAIKHLAVAAKAGFPDAMIVLGKYYLRTAHYEDDYEQFAKGVYLLEQSAAKGDTDAIFELANLYESGAINRRLSPDEDRYPRLECLESARDLFEQLREAGTESAAEAISRLDNKIRLVKLEEEGGE